MSEREQFAEAFAKITSKPISIRGMAWAVWQAARAQPGQAGQVLTDDFIKAEALEAFDCYWDADDETLVNKYGHGVYLSRFIDFARAIEQAVLAKRVPTKLGWMCLTDFQHELGEAAGGVTIYSDLEDLKANRPCWGQCGVIEVGIVGEKGGA